MKNAGQTNIFIVDDDKLLTTSLKNEILKNFEEEDIVLSVFEAGEQLELSLNRSIDIAIVDFHMNSRYKDAMNGLNVMGLIKLQNPEAEIIMFTGEENAELVKRAFKYGAYDYVVKNDYMFQKLNVSLQQCIRLLNLKRELRREKSRSRLAIVAMALLLAIMTGIQIFMPYLL